MQKGPGMRKSAPRPAFRPSRPIGARPIGTRPLIRGRRGGLCGGIAFAIIAVVIIALVCFFFVLPNFIQ